MANDRKQGLFSSLFGKRKQTEEEATAELESKQRLEARIEQMLAERAAVSEILKMKDNEAAEMPKEEEVEPEVELFPISASVVSIRKAPTSSSYRTFEAPPRSYAANR